MLLQHIHYPSTAPILYTHALHLQELLARQHLNNKALLAQQRNFSSPENPPPVPKPKLLTFTSQPVYTTGLRDSKSLITSQLSHLTATGAGHHASPRGGLTTYHGPGQLTAFLITTLSSHALSPRCFVHFLEDSVIRTSEIYSVKAARWSPLLSSTESLSPLTETTPNESRPGVWTGLNSKLCSVGIHFRRGVSSFGIGFNVTDEVKPWFDRIVACGIPESRAVSLQGEQVREARLNAPSVSVDGVAKTLAGVVADGLEGVDGVEDVDVRALGDMEG